MMKPILFEFFFHPLSLTQYQPWGNVLPRNPYHSMPGFSEIIIFLMGKTDFLEKLAISL